MEKEKERCAEEEKDDGGDAKQSKREYSLQIRRKHRLLHPIVQLRRVTRITSCAKCKLNLHLRYEKRKRLRISRNSETRKACATHENLVRLYSRDDYAGSWLCPLWSAERKAAINVSYKYLCTVSTDIIYLRMHKWRFRKTYLNFQNFLYQKIWKLKISYNDLHKFCGKAWHKFKANFDICRSRKILEKKFIWYIFIIWNKRVNYLNLLAR